MQHSRQDQIVALSEIDRVVEELQIEEARALALEALKADGTPISLKFDFGIGRSGGIAFAIQKLRSLKGT